MHCKRNNPLDTIHKLIREKYSDAKAVFWGGSVSHCRGTSASDLDLIIVFESLPNAYREAFIYDDWPIDAFIHTTETLRYFCSKLEASDGRPALINMIIHGQEILVPNSVSIEAKAIADDALSNGPNQLTQEQINKERFLITDILDDIIFPQSRAEQINSAIHLFEPLLQFYFRAQKKWSASGKSLIRLLQRENPILANEVVKSFELCFSTGKTAGIEKVVQQILKPYGGLFWNGFRSDAPAELRLSVEDNRQANVKGDELEKIYALEIALLEPEVRKDIKK